MDVNRPTVADVAGWGESRWVGSWSPDSETGLWLHVGRCRQDLDLWWVQMNVYLPGDRLVVSRSWCRAGADTTVLDGNLRLIAEKENERFSLTFDGGGELTTTAELAERVGGGGISIPFQVEMTGAAAAPPFDPFGGHAGEEPWASRHTQQLYSTRGTVTVDGDAFMLDGVGYVDHSSGRRDFSDFGGHDFAMALFPGLGGIHAMTFRDLAGEPKLVTGVWFAGESSTGIAAMDMPQLGGLTGEPRRFVLRVDRHDGETTTFDVEILHTLPVTITDDNDNLNGIGWHLEKDALLLNECAARFTASDGSVGYGQIARSARRNTLANN